MAPTNMTICTGLLYSMTCVKKSLQKIHVFKNISEIHYLNHYNKVHIYAHSDWLKKVLYEIIKHGDKVCIEK